MPEKQLKISIDEQVGFFLPIIENHVQKLATAISTAQKQDFTESEWLIIFSAKKSGKFLNHHFLTELWDDIASFLKKQAKLYFFIDSKAKGLVEKSYKFWLFFSPNTAADFFAGEIDKPHDFNQQNIKPVPFPDLVPPLIESVDTTLAISLSNNVKIMEKLNEMISLADFYLDGEELAAFDKHTKTAISDILSREIELLKTDIENPAISPGLIHKRLLETLKLGWRYFRAKNELETNYFKKIISEDNAERLKGLNLASKKVKDYISNPGDE